MNLVLLVLRVCAADKPFVLRHVCGHVVLVALVDRREEGWCGRGKESVRILMLG